MTSKLKVNVIADGGDNAIMTSDGSGTLTLNNAALKNTPAFLAVRDSGNVTPSANTWTNYTFNTAHINLGSGFSTSDGYFTVPSGGAGYYFFASQFFASEIDTNELAQIRHGFDIGSAGSFTSNTARTRIGKLRGYESNSGEAPQVHTFAQLNVGDKVNTQVYVESGSIYANNDINYFIGYRLIGA
tara:strand:- start:6952 stop:7509 length:558 start_codon:yes stop_codon:yes gene_type:complete